MAVTSLQRLDANGDLPHAPRTGVDSGCRTLLWALIEDVFIVRDTLNRISPRDGRYRSLTGASDREWLAAESDCPFSFLWVCQHLGLEPDAIRQAYDHGHAIRSSLLAGWKNASRGAFPITAGRTSTRRMSAYAPRAVL